MKKFRFSNQMLFILIALAALVFARVAQTDRQRISLIRRVESAGGNVQTLKSVVPFIPGKVVEVTLPGQSLVSFDVKDLREFNHIACVRLENFSMSKPGKTGTTSHNFDTPKSLELLFGDMEGWQLGPPKHKMPSQGWD